MRNLPAMLLFDLNNLRSMGVGAAVLFVLVGIFMFTGNTAMAPPMFAVVLMLLGQQLFTLDATRALPLLYESIPTTRRTVMTSHYLVAGGAIVLGGLVMAGMLGVVSSFRPELPWGENMAGVAVMLVAMSLVQAVQIPFTVRFGAKGVLAMLLLLAVFGFVGGFVFAPMFVGEPMPAWLADALVWATRHPWWLALLAAGFTVVVWLVSYLVSLRVFKRQDF